MHSNTPLTCNKISLYVYRTITQPTYQSLLALAHALVCRYIHVRLYVILGYTCDFFLAPATLRVKLHKGHILQRGIYQKGASIGEGHLLERGIYWRHGHLLETWAFIREGHLLETWAFIREGHLLEIWAFIREGHLLETWAFIREGHLFLHTKVYASQTTLSNSLHKTFLKADFHCCVFHTYVYVRKPFKCYLNKATEFSAPQVLICIC